MIRKRLESVRMYSKFKGKDQELEKKSFENNLCDIGFFLHPILKITNSLPRNITLKKELKNDIKSVVNLHQINVKGDEKELNNYFDIDYFIKIYNNHLISSNHKSIQIEGSFTEFAKDRVVRLKERLLMEELVKAYKSFDIDANISTLLSELKDKSKILRQGESISIYESFFLNDNYVKNLVYKVFIEKSDQVEGEEVNSLEKKNLYEFEGEFQPFNLPIITSMVVAKYEKSKLNIEYSEFGEKIINKPKKIKNVLKMHEILLYSVETNSYKCLNSYIYCPYLFLNSSDLDLKLEFNNTFFASNFNNLIMKNNEYQDYQIEKYLPEEGNKKIDKNDIESSASIIKLTTASRLILFYPEHKKNFKFHVRNSKCLEENILIELDELNKENNKYEICSKIDSNKEAKVHEEFEIKEERKETAANQLFNSRKTEEEKKDKKQKLYSKKKSQIELLERRNVFSIQVMKLDGHLRHSNLLFITPYIYIRNTLSIPIYLISFHEKIKQSFIVNVLKPNKIFKFYYMHSHFEIFKFSMDDKFRIEDGNQLSGMVKFTENIREFYIKLPDKENNANSHLLHVKVIKEYSFLYVVIKEKHHFRDFPYCIINNLEKPIKFKQQEIFDKDTREFYETYYFKHNIVERNIPSRLNWKKSKSEKILKKKEDEIPINNQYYSWDEPFMKEKGSNIIELYVFGCKFCIDLDDIHEEVKFSDRLSLNYEDCVHRENLILKGIIKTKERFGINYQEYIYKLYDFGLFIESKDDEEEQQSKIVNKFDFFDSDLKFFRKSNGNIVLKKQFIENEMFCLSDEETNRLGGSIYKSLEKCQEILKSVYIKKYVRDKSIVLEISDINSNDLNEELPMKTIIILNIKNLGLSLIEKNREFLYFWLNEFSLGIKKRIDIYENISIKLKDFQIDHFINKPYYPIIFSPLIDRSRYSGDYFSINIEIKNFIPSLNFYQFDSIELSITSCDFRLEYKIIEKLQNFLKLFSSNSYNYITNEVVTNNQYLWKLIQKVDLCKFMDESKLQSYENIILIKQFVISEIKCCFSLKFDKIDMFLEGKAFLILRPLVEELGLKIINMDSILFNFIPYIKINIFQSVDEFGSNLSKFYYDLLMTELIKALGGISSIASSMQIMENFKNNILLMNINSIAEGNGIGIENTNKQLQEIAKSSYQNLTQLIASIFIMTFKILSVFGKFLALLSYDKAFKQKRSYKLNRRIKGMLDGLKKALKILIFGLLYTFTQFYYVPLRWQNKQNHCKIPIVIFILLIGLILKPIIAVNDFFSIISETISIAINDVLGNRVKIYARYPRTIKNNRLDVYDTLESFANSITDKSLSVQSAEDLHIILPCEMEGKQYILLITSEKFLVFEKRPQRFIPFYQVHFTECKVYMDHSSDDPKSEYLGKRIVFEKASEVENIKIYLEVSNSYYCWKKKQIIWVFQLKRNFEEASFLKLRYESIKNLIKSKFIDNEN